MELRVTANVIYDTYFRCYASYTNCLWWCKFLVFSSDLLTPNPVGKMDVIYLCFSPRDFFFTIFFAFLPHISHLQIRTRRTLTASLLYLHCTPSHTPNPVAPPPLLRYTKVDAVLSYPAVSHVSGWSTSEIVSSPALIGWQSKFPCRLPPVPLTYKEMPHAFLNSCY